MLGEEGGGGVQTSLGGPRIGRRANFCCSLLYISLYRKLLYKAESRCIRRYTRTRIASRPSRAIQHIVAIQRYTLYRYTALYTIQPLQHPSGNVPAKREKEAPLGLTSRWLHSPHPTPLPIPVTAENGGPHRATVRLGDSHCHWLTGPLSRSLGNDGQEAARLHELVEVESAVAVLVHLVEQG